MKKILLGIGVFVVLLIGAAVALPFIFKDKIIAMIKTEANKNLKATMDFEKFDLTILSSFPDFTLDLYEFSLVGKNEFEGDTLTHIKKFEFTIDLMSVVKGEEIKVKSILLEEPSIMAKVLKDGKANWDIAISDEEKAQEAGEPSKFKASLKRMEIKAGRIIYDDLEGDMYAKMDGFNFKMKGDFTQDNFILETFTTIDALTYKYEGVKLLNKVNTIFKADMDMDMPNMKFTFKDNEVQLNQLFLGFDGWVGMPADDIDMDINWFAKKTAFKNILSLVPAVYTQDFENVKTAGTLALNGHVKGRYNDQSMPGFGLKLLVENAMFQYPDFPKAVTNIHVDLKIDNKDGIPDNTVIDLNRFYMLMADNPVEMKMRITTPESDANIDGVVKAKVLLSSVKDVVPMEEGESMNGTIVADVAMKGKMSSIEKEQYDQFNFEGALTVLDMDYQSKDLPYNVNISKMYLNFSPRYAELSSFESKIGKSDISASGRIDNLLNYFFKDDALTGTLRMNSNLMDLNEFMTEDETATAANPAVEEPMTVIEVPGNINFTLTASMAKMIYDNIEMQNVSGAIKIADQKVSMNNLKMNLLDGTMVMNGFYETVDPKSPGISYTLNISNFDIQQTAKTFVTVKKMAPIAEKCFGKFSTSMKIEGKLDEKMEPLMNSLAGGGMLSTAGVIVQNFEPISKMADALKMEQYKKLSLNDVKLEFEFADGRIEIRPFELKIGNTIAKVSGSTGFDQTINYTWNLDIPRSEFGGAANAVLTGLLSQAQTRGANINIGERVKVDVFVEGTVKEPKIRTGLKDAAGNLASDLKDKAKEEFDKKKAELEAKAREEADKLKKEAEDRAKAEVDKLKGEAEKVKAEAEAKLKAEQDRLKAEAEKIKKEAEEKAKKEAKDKIKGFIKP
jgi:hypothetical protein